MKNRYHTLVIGTGCAGYNAADRLYGFGVRDIAIVTEGRFTTYAQEYALPPEVRTSASPIAS